MKVSDITSLWHSISTIGIAQCAGRDEECRRIKLLNQFTFIILSCSLISAIYSFFNHKYYDVIVIIIVLLLFSVILYFQRLKKYKIAFLSLHIFTPVIIAAVMMIFGKNSGIEVFYAPLIITLPIFHGRWQSRIVLFIWMMILLIFAQAYIISGGVSPLSYNVTQVARITAIFVSNLCCLAIFVTYMADDKRQRNQNEALLNLLKVNNEKLNTANADLERFAYVASHQLKAPVRTITNFVKLMERELRKYPDNPHIVEYLNYVTGSSKEMAMLIDDLLEYSKLEQEELQPEPIDLNDALLVVQNNLRATLEHRNVQLSIGELPVVDANRTQMVVLFQNLVENAIKYNDAHQPSVSIYADEVGNLQVQDNGIGIDKQYHQRIFGMFARLHSQDEYMGTGIGLSVCKKIMEKHNGDISVDSTPGEGTTFYIRFYENKPTLSCQNTH